MAVGGGAGDDDVDLARGARELVLADPADLVGASELLGPAGGRVHEDVGDAAVAEGREARSGVGPGAHEEDALRGPVVDPALGEVEGEPHDGAAGAAERRAVLDAAGGLRGALEQALEFGAGGAAGPSGLERTPDLSRDLALADDD